MSGQVNRREFLKYSALAAGAAAWPGVSRGQAAKKVNVAFIGVGGRGWSDLEETFKAGCNVVALCDIDTNHLAKAAKTHPGAKTYSDYRKLFEQHTEFDAVVVATPDHHHFPASMMALKLGKHVYCEKPLTHTVWEARQLMLAARQAKVATQMGTQGHAGEPIRLLSEWIAAGVIGAVREVHIWTDRGTPSWWPQGMERPQGSDPVPSSLNWDAWLGPAPQRPFVDKWVSGPYKGRNVYHPFVWRGWWDFGTGALGDIACHSFDLPFYALKLTAPTTVQAFSHGATREAAPLWSDIIYHFPAVGDRPAVKMTWYDGRNRGTPKGAAEYKSIALLAELAELDPKSELADNGQLYIGDKGKILITGGGPRLVPESRMKDFVRPEKSIPRSIGHHAEWIEACKGGKPAGANFDFAGPVAEAVLLGNISLRLGKKLEWDSAGLKCTNAPEADALIRKEYRKGWDV